MLFLILVFISSCDKKINKKVDKIEIDELTLLELLDGNISRGSSSGIFNKIDSLYESFVDYDKVRRKKYAISISHYLDTKQIYYEFLDYSSGKLETTLGKLYPSHYLKDGCCKTNNGFAFVRTDEKWQITWLSDTTKKYGCFAIENFIGIKKEDFYIAKNNIKIIPYQIEAKDIDIYGFYFQNEELPLNIIWNKKILKKVK